MKIQNSSVSMASVHHATYNAYQESMTIEASRSDDVAGAILTLSQEGAGVSMKEAMIEYEKQEAEEAEKKQEENEARQLQSLTEALKSNKTTNQFGLSNELDYKIKMLRQMLAMLNGKKIPDDCKFTADDVADLRSANYKAMDGYEHSSSTSISAKDVVNGSIGTTNSGTVWQRITATSGFVSESESTTFATKGLVQTADGRSISFNVEVSMSRSYMAETNLLQVENYIKTDPLMINLDTNVGSVSDQKFFFDLDSDGKEEEISFAGKGSGFLALDKNGDGVINDGSELFGTKSGDGFADLGAYDEDGNGWIDENDSIFSKLKVWTKDENGNDYLIDLKKADVGAIYIKNADTQFSLKDDENKLNAEIKKTGIYLKESTGAVGTLNHVDLVI